MPELAKTYDPVGTEARWQQAWEDQGAFHPDPKAPGEPFSVVIPPPNVTGSLHMGHAFNTALIDTIVRYQRLAGKNVLCLPGTDHASIAVQTILEKQLKEEGKTRHDLGREAFLERAWQWKAESGGRISSFTQLSTVHSGWKLSRCCRTSSPMAKSNRVACRPVASAESMPFILSCERSDWMNRLLPPWPWISTIPNLNSPIWSTPTRAG